MKIVTFGFINRVRSVLKTRCYTQQVYICLMAVPMLQPVKPSRWDFHSDVFMVSGDLL